MFLAMLSLPLVAVALGVFCYASYSEGKQLKNGAQLYANQGPKLR